MPPSLSSLEFWCRASARTRSLHGAFLLKYSQIFTKQLKDLLYAQRPECLSKIGEKGYIIGDGEIWFDKFSNGRWQVFSINLIFNH